ncbi:MAG: BMP family ABC transporter substrate-binding protein [Clostridia bacterium]|nr:BMP family ABC transporter substrate-binding protein [Clostridia bacterium]
MKKIVALLLALVMVFALVACAAKTEAPKAEEPAKTEETKTEEPKAEEPKAEEPKAEETVEASDMKVGVVLVGDENEGYTYSHSEGIKTALANLGLDESNVIWKYSIPESELCYDACVDCAEQGCKLVITNSYGHQSYCQQAAEEYPDVQFVAMTGDTARAAGLENFHNAFTGIYEARYVGGIVAGLKLQELIDNGEVKDNNIDENGNYKIGYVGAYPYAEVVSGFTAFFLGIKSIVPNVAMDVQYTNSWFDITGENEAAVALIGRGCIIIGQHADSTGAPSACEAALKAGTTVYSVGYNVDMLSVAPTAALTSPTNVWSVYYTSIIEAVMNGQSFDTNWSAGSEADAVKITDLGASCAAGTAEAVEAAIAAIKSGELHVFDTATFTVGGEEVTTAFATDTDGDWVTDADEAVFDGYFHESYFQSAPAFALRIDGITELN